MRYLRLVELVRCPMKKRWQSVTYCLNRCKHYEVGELINRIVQCSWRGGDNENEKRK